MEKNNLKRRNFYLGSILFEDIENIKLTGNTSIISSVHDKIYAYPLRTLLIKTNNFGKKLNYQMGDIDEILQNSTILCKNRQNCYNGVILRCLEFDRHWYNYYNKPFDLPFKNKKNSVIWRGSTTGRLSKPGNRFILLENWFNKNKNIDLGFNNICQGKDKYKKYFKDTVSIEKMLNYKYIISVEGNDKDSGINWKLNSNSLILMAKPRATSWLMETTLIPDFHYVLLKDDFSDLEEKYLWCENNQDKCEEIINNAKIFMSQFLNKKNEKQIEIDVINKYFEILKKKNNHFNTKTKFLF